VDCADPQCISSPSCQNCSPEVCNDGLDNNCDGKIDCADTACFFAPNCAPTQELCNNGLDDDNDTLIDCLDPDCANNPLCVLQQANCLSPRLIPGSGTYTGDTTGNISETKGVCGGDAGEAVFYFVLTQPTRVELDSIGTSFDSTLYVRTGACNSGAEIGCDDDSAGSNWAARLVFQILYPGTYYVFLDGYTVDPFGGANEGPFALNVEFTPNPPEICNDGLDNDGDVYVDCADPQCTNVGACQGCLNGGPPGPEFGAGACTDGLDNDCDGTTDCADEDCSASEYYVTECCNNADENGNGIPDDFNCRCASNADCPSGQICYTSTAYSCGIPCNFYFGNVCPFVAAGSYCNQVTGQCEF
ncbi:MAG TPA: PPC domain-containing protein, partial [Candidatus Nanopelagicales bacterium]|nr:PPC domain-containing protein [Candidatus Nanopelagicales bacterium]